MHNNVTLQTAKSCTAQNSSSAVETLLNSTCWCNILETASEHFACTTMSAVRVRDGGENALENPRKSSKTTLAAFGYTAHSWGFGHPLPSDPSFSPAGAGNSPHPRRHARVRAESGSGHPGGSGSRERQEHSAGGPAGPVPPGAGRLCHRQHGPPAGCQHHCGHRKQLWPSWPHAGGLPAVKLLVLA